MSEKDITQRNLADQSTRQFNMEIDLKQDPKTVWNAISKAEELERWFPVKAEVESEVGGRVLFSWETNNWAFDTRVAIWEPERRMTLIERKSNESQPVEVAMDFQLEGHAGGTTLRLVHSGFGRGADWDGEFDGITHGWNYELRMLRYYLNHHQGKDRHIRLVPHQSDLPDREVFNRLFGPKGMAAEGGVFGVPEGEIYQMKTAWGEAYEGRVLVADPPRTWSGSIVGLDNGIMRFTADCGAPTLTLATWGDTGAIVDQFAEQWKERMAGLL